MRGSYVLGAAALGVLALAAYNREKVAQVASDTGDAIAAKVADVYYSLSPDSRANEEKFASAIAAAESHNGIPAGLLHRQLFQESHFRSDIISGEKLSPAGAVGIAQIVPRFHPSVDPTDPWASIDYAAAFMKRLHARFGSWSLALAAYNAGEGNVAKYGGVPPFPETERYVAAITADVGVA